MTDRPIIFSGPMVHALTDGRKTQTRRMLKWQPMKDLEPHGIDGDVVSFVDPKIRFYRQSLPCATGDRLWVREAWAAPYLEEGNNEVFYRADREKDLRWRPSIHMPRWASRLTLTVTDVKVERLQDISFEDCRAEGMDVAFKVPAPDCTDPTCPGEHRGEKWHFHKTWNTIHGPGAWDANPWVCALTFTVEQKNIDQ